MIDIIYKTQKNGNIHCKLIIKSIDFLSKSSSIFSNENFFVDFCKFYIFLSLILRHLYLFIFFTIKKINTFTFIKLERFQLNAVSNVFLLEKNSVVYNSIFSKLFPLHSKLTITISCEINVYNLHIVCFWIIFIVSIVDIAHEIYLLLDPFYY